MREIWVYYKVKKLLGETPLFHRTSFYVSKLERVFESVRLRLHYTGKLSVATRKPYRIGLTFTDGTLFSKRFLEQSDFVLLHSWKLYVLYWIGFWGALSLRLHSIWSHASVCVLLLLDFGLHSTITALDLIFNALASWWSVLLQVQISLRRIIIRLSRSAVYIIPESFLYRYKYLSNIV